MPTKKPETIRVSAEGIESRPITMNEPDMGVNWERLSRLPPFQMYVAETEPAPEGEDSEQWALKVALRHKAEGASDHLYENYCQWHRDKGYWPSETPTGERRA